MIIGQLELIMFAHALDWLPAVTIFTFGPSITYRTSVNPFHTLGPSVTCRTSAIPFQTLGPSITYRTSANPFQTLGPSPTEFRPGHSNMLAQTIPKSRLTRYFQSWLASAGLLSLGPTELRLGHSICWPRQYLNLGQHITLDLSRCIILNLGRDWLACYYRANVQPDWTALSVQSD